MNKNIWQFIHRNLRSCPCCGNSAKNFLFCQDCLLKLDLEQQHSNTRFGQSALGRTTILSAYNWTPDRNQRLSQLISNLKNHNVDSDWRYFAEQIFFPRQLEKLRGQDIKTRFVPVPSVRGRPDHAFYFAKALAKSLDGEFAPILRRMDRTQQHSKSRQERRNVEFKLSEIFTHSNPFAGRTVIVDDVLTTGETAKAAIAALQAKHPIEVWVVARRSLASP